MTVLGIKRSPQLFGFVLFLANTQAFAQAQCASAAGTWFDSDLFKWSLGQNVIGGISGWVQVAADTCPNEVWNSSGTFWGNGEFSVRAHNPIGGGTVETCVLWFQYDGRINKPGCHTGQGTWTSTYDNVNYYHGTWSWSKPCDVPNGEITTSNGWADAEGYPTVHRWSQTLTPSSVNFGGRTVTEADAPGGAGDTCHFPASDYPPFDTLSGGSWDVGTQNLWESDYVGWLPQPVAYYRSVGRAPCGFTLGQAMYIDCGGPDPSYVGHILTSAIGITTVSSTRAGKTETRTWP